MFYIHFYQTYVIIRVGIPWVSIETQNPDQCGTGFGIKFYVDLLFKLGYRIFKNVNGFWMFWNLDFKKCMTSRFNKLHVSNKSITYV